MDDEVAHSLMMGGEHEDCNDLPFMEAAARARSTGGNFKEDSLVDTQYIPTLEE